MPTPVADPAKVTALRGTHKLGGERHHGRRTKGSDYDAADNKGDALADLCDDFIHRIKGATVVIVGANIGIEAELFAQYANSVIAIHVDGAPDSVQARHKRKRAARRLAGYTNVEIRQEASSAAAAATFADDEVDVVYINTCCKTNKSKQTAKLNLIAEIKAWRPKAAFLSGADYGHAHTKKAVRRTLGRKIAVIQNSIWWRHTK